MTFTWLVSSAGRRGALVRILNELPLRGGCKVVATDASPLSSAGRLADDFEIVPRIGDATFIPEMVRLAGHFGIDCIVPTIDTELATFALHRGQFRAAGTDVLVSSPDVITLASDKWKLFEWLTRAGFPTVRTFELTGFEPADLTGAVVAKPRGGSSSIGVIRAGSASDLPTDGLTDDYIIQERAQGVEITVDFAVSRSGRFLGAVPRRRLEVRAGEVSKGVTLHLPVVEQLVRDFAAALPGPYGVLNLQVFYEPASRSVSIIELNARVGGGYPLTHEAGADFFTQLATGGDAEQFHWRENLVMLRYDDAVFYQADLGVMTP